jgi:hypothetical protein
MSAQCTVDSARAYNSFNMGYLGRSELHWRELTLVHVRAVLHLPQIVYTGVVVFISIILSYDRASVLLCCAVAAAACSNPLMNTQIIFGEYTMRPYIENQNR